MIMLQPYLYDIIRKYVDERVKSKVFPFIATENQIYAHVLRDVKETLAEMETDGLVCHSENINAVKLYRPIDNETDNVQ